MKMNKQISDSEIAFNRMSILNMLGLIMVALQLLNYV